MANTVKGFHQIQKHSPNIMTTINSTKKESGKHVTEHPVWNTQCTAHSLAHSILYYAHHTHGRILISQL